MSKRFYTLRQGKSRFITGLARGGQVLFGNTVHDIVAHWFDREGLFLGLERFPMAVAPPTFSGTTIYRTGREYHRQVDTEVAAVKQRLGFMPANICVQAFDSEEAGILDLPAEYEEYLKSPESYSTEDRDFFQEAIEKWRREGNFVFSWYEEIWVSATGEVIAT
jgi:hypothetical protein